MKQTNNSCSFSWIVSQTQRQYGQLLCHRQTVEHTHSEENTTKSNYTNQWFKNTHCKGSTTKSNHTNRRHLPVISIQSIRRNATYSKIGRVFYSFFYDLTGHSNCILSIAVISQNNCKKSKTTGKIGHLWDIHFVSREFCIASLISAFN